MNVWKQTRVVRLFPRGLATSSGPQGVDGRTPRTNNFGIGAENSNANQLSITDPFIVYQNLVKQGLLQKDEAQLRAMKEFQKLYYRVIDYKPPQDVSIKIQLLLKQLEVRRAQEIVEQEKNGMVTIFRLSTIQNLFRKDPEAEKQQLIRIMSDDEEIEDVASPRGLLLNGEVGCGKSMLMDLFAESLPHASKMRWHYNNFILSVYNEMHTIQNEKLFTSSVFEGLQLKTLSRENEFVLFEIAQKMINKSTILMLDEFMLPDIAAANVIKILFTYYFKLGGVLVATSNRLPEDLYSSEFHKKHFQNFTRILHSKCDSVDMNSLVDYRVVNAKANALSQLRLVVGTEEESKKEWDQLLQTCIGNQQPKPSSIKVYGRTTVIDKTFNNNLCCILDFENICVGLFSSSDYITLASTYNTIILENVPQLKLAKKDEARRLITLIDALYEAKCQLYMKCETPLDQLFFADAEKVLDHNAEEARLKVQQEEMFAKTVLDLEAPYRPNISEYKTEYKGTINKDKNGAIIDKSTNFLNVKAFTGEDEKFAYKRAVLRMEEMLNSTSWRCNTWIPLDGTMRPWEGNTSMVSNNIELFSNGRVIGAKSVTGNSYLPIAASAPRSDAPRIREHHIWKMGFWTRENGKRLKDEIAKKWLLTGAKDEVRNFHNRIRDE